jgi:serine/threonine protein kinase
MALPPLYVFRESDPISYIEELGVGGFGRVSKSRFQGVEVACKQLCANYSDEGMEKELALLDKVRGNPYFIELIGYTCNCLNVCDMIVTKFYDGGSLHAYTEKLYVRRAEALTFLDDPNKGLRSIKMEILSLLDDTRRGLIYLHNLNIVHRDIKPDNIFICCPTQEERSLAKIGDLGLAAYSTTGYYHGVCGTQGFKAPEMYVGAYTTNIDVFSFGKTAKAALRDMHYIPRWVNACCLREPLHRPPLADIQVKAPCLNRPCPFNRRCWFDHNPAPTPPKAPQVLELYSAVPPPPPPLPPKAPQPVVQPPPPPPKARQVSELYSAVPPPPPPLPPKAPQAVVQPPPPPPKAPQPVVQPPPPPKAPQAVVQPVPAPKACPQSGQFFCIGQSFVPGRCAWCQVDASAQDLRIWMNNNNTPLFGHAAC